MLRDAKRPRDYVHSRPERLSSAPSHITDLETAFGAGVVPPRKPLSENGS